MAAMDWWKANRMRLIQNNLNDTNGAMDTEQWIRDLQSFACNTVLVGVGGITSFFPTELKYQTVSPFLPEGRDLIREMLDGCHRVGIRVMGRFDFARTQERFYTDHPEWYYRSADGKLLRASDTVTTCICGWYQQEYAKEIVREALERYPDLDGIFFNAYGFTSWDYYGNNYGPCHCENCRRLFREFSGMDLPKAEGDPAMPKYREFQRETVARTLRSMQETIRSLRPGLCLCTYASDGTDMVKDESNTVIGKPVPFLLMNSSFRVAMARHSLPGQPLDNCVINATDLRWRYAGVSPNLTRIRLYENIAAGGSLDFCINGVFADYPDRESLEPVKEIFRYHRDNEEIYGNLISQARLAVIRPDEALPMHVIPPELLGIMKALKEEHILFDVLTGRNLEENPEMLEKYEAVIVPDIGDVSDGFLRMAKDSGKIFILSAVNREMASARSELLGIRMERVEKDNAGAYLETRPKEIFRRFPGKDWVFLTGNLGLLSAPGYEPLLPYVEKGTFGPAERAWGSRPTGIGTLLKKGGMILAAWSMGKLYGEHGCQDHKYILADLLDAFCPGVRVVRTDAHPSVEIFWDGCGKGMLLQALNLSGFNGNTVEAPVPMRDVEVTVPCRDVKARVLAGGEAALRETPEGTEVIFRCLETFAAVVLEKK